MLRLENSQSLLARKLSFRVDPECCSRWVVNEVVHNDVKTDELPQNNEDG